MTAAFSRSGRTGLDVHIYGPQTMALMTGGRIYWLALIQHALQPHWVAHKRKKAIGTGFFTGCHKSPLFIRSSLALTGFLAKMSSSSKSGSAWTGNLQKQVEVIPHSCALSYM